MPGLMVIVISALVGTAVGSSLWLSGAMGRKGALLIAVGVTLVAVMVLDSLAPR